MAGITYLAVFPVLCALSAACIIASAAAQDADAVTISDKPALVGIFSEEVPENYEGPQEYAGGQQLVHQQFNPISLAKPPAGKTSLQGLPADVPAVASIPMEYEPTLADLITSASAETGVPESWLWATGEVESSNAHRWEDGTVKHADGGLSIGWGQVQEDPWQAHASKQLGREIDLYIYADNVAAAACVLAYYIDTHGMDIVTVAGSYNAGNGECNRSYGRKVARIERGYRGEQ